MNYDATNPRRNGEEPPAPDKLVAALKELPARRVFVPPTVDEAVLRAAKQHLIKPQQRGFDVFFAWLRWPVWVAVCLAIIGLVFFFARPTGVAPLIAREDINHDGQVNILDAFQLARELQSGQKLASGLDLNGDGAVNRRDVEIIAIQAVKLKKGGRL